MEEKTAHKLHIAAFVLSPVLRITVYISLLSGLAAAGVKAAGTAAQRRSFAYYFSPFSLFISYAELAVVGKFDKLDKNQKSDCGVKACRKVLMTVYVSLESVFLPWVLTQAREKGGINPYLAVFTTLFTNALMAQGYGKTRKWLYRNVNAPAETTGTQAELPTTSSTGNQTLLPATDEGQTSDDLDVPEIQMEAGVFASPTMQT